MASSRSRRSSTASCVDRSQAVASPERSPATPKVKPPPRAAPPPVASPKNHTPPYYGRKDLSLLCERTVKSFFPSSSSASLFSPDPERQARRIGMSAWVAYVLYRTALPDTTVFHALHLLRRLAGQSQGFPEFEHEFLRRDSTMYHRALMICALICATIYNMDDSFALSSWSIATKSLFTTPELSTLTLHFLSSLSHLLRQPGEDLGEILLGYQRDWEASLARRAVGDEVAARAAARERQAAAALAAAAPASPVREKELRHQPSARSLSRARSLGKALGAALLHHRAAVAADVGDDDGYPPSPPKSAPPVPTHHLLGHHHAPAVRVASR